MDTRIVIDILIELATREEESIVDGPNLPPAGVAELGEDIERLLGQLPPDIGRHARRLRTRYDRSVSYVRSGACDACFQQLPPQQAAEVARGRKLLRCAGCARYMVHRRWL